MTSVTLNAYLGRPSALGRRGSAAFSPAALAALGAVPGDAVVLRAARSTAVVAVADDSVGEMTVLVDDLILSNLGAATGASVSAEAVRLPELVEVTLKLSSALLVPDPNLLRALLVDKVLTVGDEVTLLPIDPNDPSTREARKRASNMLGASWSSFLVKVVGAAPSPGFVGASTRVVVNGAASPSLPAVNAPARVAAAQSASRSALGDLEAALDVARAQRAAREAAHPQPSRASGSKSYTSSLSKTVSAQPRARSLEDLPTLEAFARSLEEWLDLGFNHSALLETLGTSPQLGILLSASAGSGKRSLVRAVCMKLNLDLVELDGTRLSSLEQAAALSEVTTALNTTRSVVMFTNADLVFKREPSPLSTMAREAVRKALASEQVAVVMTVDKLEAFDNSLRAPGLLEHTISIPTPARPERLRILTALTKAVPLDEVDLDGVAARTPGFVASDLQALVDSAALSAARRTRTDSAQSDEGDGSALKAKVTTDDFASALKVVKASSMDGQSIEVGRVVLDDVRGVDEVKQTLVESVLWPLTYPDTFKRFGVPAPRGVLLYGPPGCGKTFLVKALAGEGRANIFSVKGASLLSKWVGDSEAEVRNVFRRAREASPSIIFLDEVDALAPARGNDNNGVTDRVVAALLTELDGVEELSNVVVIGATNRPDLVDPALLRPGRLGRLVFVSPPNAPARAEILRGSAKGVPFTSEVDWDQWGGKTEDFSAADCSALIQEAALTAMRDNLEAQVVTLEHLEKAFTVVKPSLDKVSVEHLKAYAASR